MPKTGASASNGQCPPAVPVTAAPMSRALSPARLVQQHPAMMQDMQLAPPRQPHWERWLLGLYIATIVVISIPKGFWDPDNNFAIFRAAFGNLISGRDLYVPHPAQYLDLFKYSPTFALLFSPFSIL